MNFKIPFKGRGHSYTQDEIDLVSNIMANSDTLTQGKYLQEFEKKYQSYIGVDYAFAMSSATAALEIAAQLCLFNGKDEVVIPSHTYTATAYPFIKKGARVIWADIDPVKRVATAETISKCITKNTKAIIIVHLYGFAADMTEIRQLADQNNLILIEDCAQSLGTEVNGKKTGSYGDFSIFSHHSQKNISTLGEGGILIASDNDQASVIPMLRHNGHSSFENSKQYWKPAMSNVDFPKYNGIELEPNNFCLGEPQCALGAKIIDRIDDVNNLKRERAIQFIDSLADSSLLEFHRVNNTRHNYQHLVAEVKNNKRDIFIEKMAYEMGVQCITQYYPLHRYPYYIKHGYGVANCPNTDQFFDNMVSFPFYETMTDSELNYMTDATRKTLEQI
jgi:perosamine synthetase